MLRHVEAAALEKNIGSLMLQVNKRNTVSISIYRKVGFQVRAEAIFDIGNGYIMDDYVMEKTITNRGQTPVSTIYLSAQ